MILQRFFFDFRTLIHVISAVSHDIMEKLYVTNYILTEMV